MDYSWISVLIGYNYEEISNCELSIVLVRYEAKWVDLGHQYVSRDHVELKKVFCALCLRRRQFGKHVNGSFISVI